MTAGDQRHPVVLNGGMLQSLADNLAATLRIAAPRHVLTCSQPGNVLVRHIVPSQSELDVTSKLFNTAEVLEVILLKLPAKELLFRAQLVCKHFRTAIQDTHSLQRKLFLAHHNEAEISAVPATKPHQAPPFGIRGMNTREAREDPPSRWYFLATVRPRQARSLSEFHGLCEMYVAQPTATAFMLREACEDPYLHSCWDVQALKQAPIIKVHGGVKFKHIFAAIDVFSGDWDCEHSTTSDRVCEAYEEDNHEMQIDLSYSRRSFLGLSTLMHEVSVGLVYEAKSLESDVEAWKYALHRKHVAG